MSVPIRVPVPDASGDIVKNRFMEFLRTFRENEDMNATTQQRLMTDYMSQMATMMQNNKSTIYVNFQHIMQVDHELAEAIELEYYRFEPYLRHAVHEIIAQDNQHYVVDVDRGQREFFVSIYNLPRVERIRAMKTDKIGRLIAISGTVTRSSEVRPELLYGSFICKKCGTMHPSVEQQFQFTEPQICKNPQCSKGDFQLILNQSAFVDWQRLRVQENADEIPAGSMPRCVDVICRNEIVELAKAGDKMIFTGTVAVIPDASGLARAGESTTAAKSGGRNDGFGDGVAGLKKLGVKEMTYKLLFIASAVQHTDQRTGGPVNGVSLAELSGINNTSEAEKDAAIELTDQEKADILNMRNTPLLYQKMVESMCPAVFGHSEVKRGVLLMLFGGVHKNTPEGISLRGDLNVCIVGDPSCAKSQFLKYVHSFLPRTVYTSGKSSSAAGLTASVVRDSETGEFCVEAGALMLADNGICCIDEFDKMDPSDQVAIHEAMEQQTISITKAGIQATLNARTSILAAANPVFGRYDRTKTLKANVAISAPIMSRFDLFFVILDECNPTIDEAIARHIIGTHRQDGLRGQAKRDADVPFSTEQLQRYIRFARTLNPRLTKESRRVLVDCYRLLRQNDILGKNKTAYRITVRQLESLVRLSEALARLHLDEVVQPVYVREAFRLLQKSIIFVETEDIELDDNEEEMDRVEKSYRKHVNDDGDDDSENHDDSNHYNGDDDGNGDDDYNDNNNGDDDYKAAASRGRTPSSAGKRKRGEPSSQDTAAAAAAAEGDEEQDQQGTAMDVSESGAGAGGKKEKKRDKGKEKDRQKDKEGKEKDKDKEKEKEKKKTQISAKEYEDMTQMLAIRLKRLEDKEEDFNGCLWRDLLQWYLQEFQYELTSVEIFEHKKKLVSQVIRRMVKHEGAVVVVGDTDNLPNEEKLLKLHPSYQP